MLELRMWAGKLAKLHRKLSTASSFDLCNLNWVGWLLLFIALGISSSVSVVLRTLTRNIVVLILIPFVMLTVGYAIFFFGKYLLESIWLTIFRSTRGTLEMKDNWSWVRDWHPKV